MLNKEELKKILKEKNIKSLDEFNDFMRVISKDALESLLDREITDYLGYEKYGQEAKETDNSRNGHTPKEVQSKFGEITLEVPRDRKGEFEPVVVKKLQRDISGLEEKIVSMYAKGMTMRDIQAHIQDIYGYEMSAETISTVTDRVLERAKEWQSRPLREVYAIVFMDALFLKMRKKGMSEMLPSTRL